MNQILLAAQRLRDGHLVAIPTETVYGLAADATSETAVARIFQVKGRPKNHPLIVHIESSGFLSEWASAIPDFAFKLADAFWPGPMTLILPRSELAQDFVTGSQDTVGVRIPKHEIALQVIAEFRKLGGHGVAAPSANLFGQVSPTTAQAVTAELAEQLTEDDMILDGGPCAVGLESTIIDCTKSSPAILRPGAITAEMIELVTGFELGAADGSIRVSGSLKSHYAPKAQVVLDGDTSPGDGFIALSAVHTPVGAERLAAPETIEQYAHELYAAMRRADDLGLSRVVVVTPSGDGLAEAIRDRLRRASH